MQLASLISSRGWGFEKSRSSPLLERDDSLRTLSSLRGSEQRFTRSRGTGFNARCFFTALPLRVTRDC